LISKKGSTPNVYKKIQGSKKVDTIDIQYEKSTSKKLTVSTRIGEYNERD